MIPLTRGRFAIVDEADAEVILDRGRWYPLQRDHTCYAIRHEGRSRRTLLMHVLITGHKGTDHANRCGLDNRRVNLRVATASQQQANRRIFSNNTSGYKGVFRSRPACKWVAQIGINGHKTYLGRFDDPVDAARAYNRAALEAFGEFAYLNPVPTAPAPKLEVLPVPEEERPAVLLSRHFVRQVSPTWLQQASIGSPPLAGAWHGVRLNFPRRPAVAPLPDIAEPPAA